jgi:pseudouridine-5'-phosphate glycosidase
MSADFLRAREALGPDGGVLVPTRPGGAIPAAEIAGHIDAALREAATGVSGKAVTPFFSKRSSLDRRQSPPPTSRW